MSKLSVKVIKEVEADFKKCYVSDIKSHNKNMEKVLKNFDGYLQYCLEKCQKFEWFIIKLRIRAEDFSDFLNEAQRLGFTLIKNEQDRDIAIMYNSAYEKGRKEKSLICKQVKKFNSDLKKRRKK